MLDSQVMYRYPSPSSLFFLSLSNWGGKSAQSCEGLRFTYIEIDSDEGGKGRGRARLVLNVLQDECNYVFHSNPQSM